MRALNSAMTAGDSLAASRALAVLRDLMNSTDWPWLRLQMARRGLGIVRRTR